MPRYLAQDFVRQTVSKKQQLLGRMLLACPEHLEYVGAYPHQGRLTDSLFLAPWKHTTSEQDVETSAVGLRGGLLPSVCEDDLFWPELQSPSALCVCLKELTKFCHSVLLDELVFNDAPDYPTAISSPELIGSLGSHDQSHDTMSLEIELAMEAEEEGLVTRIQGLCAEPLESWIREEEDLLQEDMLDLDLCYLGVLHLPSLTVLTQRLQPKPVQDPFTDHTGHRRRHTTVLTNDLRFGAAPSCSKEWLGHREVFLGEDLHCFRAEEEDVVVVVDGNSRGALLAEPLMSSPAGAVDSLDLPKLDPFSDDDMEVEHELEGLCSAFPSKLGHGEPMEVGEREAAKGKDVSFALMNHTSVAVALSDSVDSGCQHMYLESPSCCPGDLGEGGASVAALSKEGLALLEAIPTSPEVEVRRMRIIESSVERRLMEDLRNKELLFDDILACLLPVPKCCEQLAEIPSPSFTAATLCLKPMDKDTESEFSLLWDPLHDGHVAMEMAQMALRADCHFPVGSTTTALRVEEVFVFRRETLELQGVAEGYISLFGGEVCGHKAGYQPRPSTSSSNASLPSSNRQTTRTTAKPASLVPLHKAFGPQKQVADRDSSASGGGVSVGGDALRANMSPLDFFVMMRKGSSQGPSPQVEKKTICSEASMPSLAREGEREDREGKRGLSEQHYSEGQRQREEVVLSGVFLMAYELLEHQGQMALNTLHRMHHLGQQLPARFGGVQVDAAEFLLRQQEAMTAAAAAQGDTPPEPQQGVVYDSCQWSAILLVLASVADCLLNSSFDSALNQLLLLTEQYTHYIGDSLNHVRADLGKVQIQLTGGGSCLHPKAEWLVTKMASWSTAAGDEGRRRWRKKAVVLIDGDFTVISAEVMNALNAVSGLSTCVFALAPKHPGDMDYLQEVETRLQHYSCLVVPPSGIADCFPWERISLVIEYNSPTHSHTHIVRYHTHMEVCTLRGVVREDVPVATADMWTQSACGGVQYRFICSQAVTSDVRLMQLLESRFNIVILERDYNCLTASSSNSKGEGLTRVLHYADVILDECCGILLHPLDQLASPEGFKAITTRVTTLSLQFEKLWILLYNAETGRYPYGGHVPVNISKIHASVANFSSDKDSLVVHVLVAGSVEDAACYVRQLGEKAHSNTKSWSSEDWRKRNWLVNELSAHEKFLLHFPCLTAFSSQLMLATSTLKDLLTSDCASLLRGLPWIPEKCLKMFHTLSHLSTSSLTHTLPTHLTTTVAPAKASHMPVVSTSQGQNQLPSSADWLLNIPQSSRPTKAPIVPTQGVLNSGLISGQKDASQVPTVDRLGVGGSHIGTTSNLVGGHFQNENGDQFNSTVEQAQYQQQQQQRSHSTAKQRQKKSFYRYIAPADSVVALQGGTDRSSMQLSGPLGVRGGSPGEQREVVRSKFFADGSSHGGPDAGVQRGLKKLLAYGRQKEGQQNTIPSTCRPLEQTQMSLKNTSTIISHGSGRVDHMFPTAAAPHASTADSTWPSSSKMLQSRGETKLAPSLAGIWGEQQEVVHGGGRPTMEGGAHWEGGGAMSLIGTTPSGRKRQPVKCLSLDSEEEGVNCGTAVEFEVHPAKKSLCPSMFTTPLCSEKRLLQGLPVSSGTSSTLHHEGGGAASVPLKPFDLQVFHSHQVAGGGVPGYPLTGNTRNNHDSFADNDPLGKVSTEATSLTHLPSRRQSKWMQWMQGDGNEVPSDSHFSFDFHPRQSPLQVVPPHQGKDPCN